MTRLYPLLLAPFLVASTAAAQDAFHNDARENLAGGGLGYRVRLEERLAVRLEARLRRWLDSDLNEYGLFVGGGVRL